MKLRRWRLHSTRQGEQNTITWLFSTIFISHSFLLIIFFFVGRDLSFPFHSDLATAAAWRSCRCLLSPTDRISVLSCVPHLRDIFLKKKTKKFNCFIVYGTWWRAGRVVIFADFSLQLLGRPIISVIARCQMRADDEMDKRGKWRSKLTDWSDYCARSR